MLSQRQLFLHHLAQTSDAPLLLEIEKAEGIYLFDKHGKKYLDLISGISVSNVGHRHPRILEAIERQLGKYLHVMVYGEIVQSPQVEYAKLVAGFLPGTLNTFYFTNSGTEAAEGAMKLAKRITGRTGFVSFRNSYHGHTAGALSVMGDEAWKQSFRPLIPGNVLLQFNDADSISLINEEVAAVIMEPVQSEAGVLLPENDFLKKVRARCDDVGAMLILDEIQTGMGRTGSVFCFQQLEVVPDVLLVAKAFGGGMPLGAFISSHENMHTFTFDPPLGHLTTFGGHPVSCAAGKAAMEVLLDDDLISQVNEKASLFHNLLKHTVIKNCRGMGLLMALEFESETFNRQVINKCIENGLFTDWFLFAPNCMRIAPPLTITRDEIHDVCKVILQSIEEILESA